MSDVIEQCEHAYPHTRHKVWRGGGSGYARCPGVDIPEGARHHKPAVRRLVLNQLREIARRTHWLISDWNVDAMMRNPRGQDERPRKVEEYPENSLKAWRELRSDCDDLIGQLAALRQAADEAAMYVAVNTEESKP
jgi:hypothetical protein